MSDFTFSITADIDLEKSKYDGKRTIRGYASTPHEDRQDESLLQKGLDITDFINYGYFNHDHDNSVILGYPYPTCKVDDKGFFVEGELLKGIKPADDIWELAVALKKSDAPRRLGFSVEGKVLEREKGRILKAKIYNVAITSNPVNTKCTWDVVVKSFNTSTLLKTLEAGYETNPLELEGGGVFRQESLEHALHNLSYVIGDDGKKKILQDKLSTKKSFSTKELVLYLQLIKGWSYDKSMDFISKHL